MVASVVYDNLSQAYWQEGRYEEGLQAAQRLLAELPEYFLGYVYLAMNAVELGRMDEARTAMKRAVVHSRICHLNWFRAVTAWCDPEIDERRNAVLRQAGLQ